LITDSFSQVTSWQQPSWSNLLDCVSKGTLPHSLLICGEPDIGKMEFAEKLAYRLLCPSPSSGYACGSCPMCLLLTSASHPDLLLIEPEQQAKVIKIEQIRLVTKFIARTSHAGAGKIIIICPAEALNINAANALLKSLEEPPAKTYFLLISHHPQSLALTIRSRCRTVMIPKPDRTQALAWLKLRSENDDFDSILDIAQGRPLAALELLDTEGVDDRLKVLECLLLLLKKEMQPVDAAALCMKLDVLQVLHHLTYTASCLIKFCMSNNFKLSEERLAKIVAEVNTGLEPTRLNRNLFRQLDQIKQSQRALMSSSNPNPQLLLEELFWSWSKLAH